MYRAFHAWQVFTRRSETERTAKSKAERHYRRTLARKAIQSWKNYTHLCFRVQILQRQSMWLHNRRILLSFHRKWKEQCQVSMQMKRKTVLALWHWSVVVQRKAFYALLEYAICRKKRANRIARAMDERRTRLLKTGVTQWLKVAFHLAAERTRFAQVRQLEVASSTHQCVLRCATHWRQWAAGRVRERGGQPRSKAKSAVKGLPVASGVPFDQPRPPTFSRDIESLLPDQHRERPRPRRPDYLRESYDVSAITMAIGKSGSHPQPQESSDEEGLPRPPPPPPSTQPSSNFHPKQRPLGDDSTVFSLSSEGDETLGDRGGESQRKAYALPFDQTPARRTEQIPRPLPLRGARRPPTLSPRDKTRPGKPLLLPPSSFLIPTPPQLGSEVEPVRRKKGSAVPAPRPAVVSPPSPTALDVSVLLSADSDLSSSADSVDSEAQDKTSGRQAGEQDGGASAEGEGLAQLLKDQKLQEKIISMRDTLQWYHDMKMEYRKLEEEREHLVTCIDRKRSSLESEEEVEDKARLQQLTEEVRSLSRKIELNRPEMERVAVSVNQLIRTAGLHV